MKVTVKARTMVRPAAAEATTPPTTTVWLSNLDLVHLKTGHVATIYTYNKTTDHHRSSASFFDVKVVKEALSKAMVPFYPMAGRLTTPDNGNGRMELDCNGEGALFLEAETESTIDELGEFLPTPEVELDKLVPCVDRYSSKEMISSVPLLLLQLTRFKCGGVCLGFGIHHVVADGPSALDFINTWSELARTHSGGLLPAGSTATTPYLDHTILKARDPPTPKFHHTEYDPHPTTMYSPTHRPNTTANATSSSWSDPIIRVLKITPEQISTLKIKANNDSRPGAKYSTHDILAAHIWRCASKARFLADKQLTKLQISVDGRSRLNPPIPPSYFGNVIFHSTPIATAGELAVESIADTSERIRRAISRMDDEYLRSAIDYLEDPGSEDGVIKIPGPCQAPNLKLVSWIRLPFRKADFGWGSPILIRKAAGYDEGTGHILPASDDGESMPLVICLEAGVMEGFQKLFYET